MLDILDKAILSILKEIEKTMSTKLKKNEKEKEWEQCLTREY